MQPYHKPLPPKPSSNAASCAVLAGTLLFLGAGVVGLVIWLVTRSPAEQRSGSDLAGSQSTPASDRPDWSSINWLQRAMPVALDDDGVEDVIGLVRRISGSGGESRDEAFAMGFNGATFQPLWKLEILAGSAFPAHHLRIALVGDRVVVSAPKFTVHALDQKTGTKLLTATLSDRAEMICPARDGRRLAWIPTYDRKAYVLDLDAGTVKEAPKPAWCQAGGSWDRSDCGTRARCAGDAFSIDVPEDIGGYQRFAEDGSLVVLGHKRHGTAVEYLMGFDVRTRALRWRATIAPDPLEANGSSGSFGDLAGGMFFATYSIRKGVLERTPDQLTAFDAASGQRLWNVQIEQAGQLVATRSRVYCHGERELQAFNPRDGRLLGKFGM